jgi:hypothetical protein
MKKLTHHGNKIGVVLLCAAVSTGLLYGRQILKYANASLDPRNMTTIELTDASPPCILSVDGETVPLKGGASIGFPYRAGPIDVHVVSLPRRPSMKIEPRGPGETWIVNVQTNTASRSTSG